MEIQRSGFGLEDLSAYQLEIWADMNLATAHCIKDCVPDTDCIVACDDCAKGCMPAVINVTTDWDCLKTCDGNMIQVYVCLLLVLS